MIVSKKRNLANTLNLYLLFNLDNSVEIIMQIKGNKGNINLGSFEDIKILRKIIFMGSAQNQAKFLDLIKTLQISLLFRFL